MKHIVQKKESERFFCLFFVLDGSSMYAYTAWGEYVTDNVIDGQNINGVARQKVDVHNYYSDHEGG